MARYELMHFHRPWSRRNEQLLVKLIDMRMYGVEVRLRPNGVTGLFREFAGSRTRTPVSAEGKTVTVHIPTTFRKRGGRKRVVTPEPRPRVDNAMVKALARAFRWRKMLDDGVHGAIEELAAAKRLPPSYVSSILRLTLLAPVLIEAILGGHRPPELRLDSLLAGFPLQWQQQMGRLRTWGLG